MTNDDRTAAGSDEPARTWRPGGAEGAGTASPASRRDRRDRDERDDRDERADGEESKGAPWYIEIPIIIVVALLISVAVQTFVGHMYLIPSESMQPTLHGCEGCTGDRIWVDKMS